MPAPLPSTAQAVLTGGRVFVGRGPQFTVLRDAWAATAAGESGAVLVAGEPGIGKTRLLAELARHAHERRAPVLWGRCDEDLVVPYQPFVEMVRQVLAMNPLQAVSDDLALLLPELGVPRPPSASPLVDSETERRRLFDAVATLVRDIAKTEPLVLVVDDLHWAAQPTLRMFRHLLDALVTSPVLIIGAYRDTESGDAFSDLLADLRRDGRVARMSLDGIAPDNVIEYLELSTVEGLTADTNELARAIHQQTKGNPFFVSELVRHLGETGEVGGHLPEGVRDVILQRVARLPHDVEHALTVAAVIGPQFDLVSLEALDELQDPDRLLDALDLAVDARLIDELDDQPGGYAFAHALVRETLLTELTLTRRARLHHRVADALRSLPGVEPGVLAMHYCAGAPAGALVDALDWSHTAAVAATEQWAMEESLGIIDRALALANDVSGVDGRQRAMLWLDRADAHAMLGDMPAAKEDAAAAATHARASGDVDLLADAAEKRTNWPNIGVPDPFGRALLEEALDQLGDESERRARTLAIYAFYLANSEGLGVEALPMVDEAIARGRDGGDGILMARCLTAKLLMHVSQANLDEQLATIAELQPLVDHIGFASGAHTLQNNVDRQHVVLRLQRGDRAGSEQAADAMRARGAQHGTPSGFEPMWRGMYALMDGRLEDAEAANTELGAFATDVNFANSWAAQLFQLRRQQGRTAELLPILEGAVAGSPGLVAMRAVLATALADNGDLSAAAELLADLAKDGLARVPKDATLTSSLASLAELGAATGDTVATEPTHRLLEPFGGQVLVLAWGVSCLGAADRYLAMLDAIAGRRADAERRFDAALELETRVQSPALAAQTRQWRERLL